MAAASKTVTSSVTNPLLDMSIPVKEKDGEYVSIGLYEQVYNSDWVYWEIFNALKKCQMELVSIQKLRNKDLEKVFEQEVEIERKKKPSGTDMNIQNLYHGPVCELTTICHDGLDPRTNKTNHAHFGRGVYFSDSPARCRIDSEVKQKLASPKNNFYLLRCRVLLGDCKVYSQGMSDPGLTREPVKSSGSGQNIYYDSVMGRPGEFTEYVVYEKRRMYVEYVIFYTCTAPLPSLPPVPTAARSDKAAVSSNQSGKNAGNRRRSGSVSSAHSGAGSVNGNNSSDEDDVSSDEDSSSDQGDRSAVTEQTSPVNDDDDTVYVATSVRNGRLNSLPAATVNKSPVAVQSVVTSLSCDSGSDAVDEVMKMLMNDFMEFTQCSSRPVVKRYLDNYAMDLTVAVNAYLTDHPGN